MSLKKEAPMTKIIFLVSSVSLVVVMALGMIAYSFNSIGGQIKSVSQISGNFGGSYGITNLTQEDKKASSGVSSTTLKFDIVGKTALPLTYSLDYLTKSLKSIKDPGLININASGTSDDKKENLDLNYYATSNEDYKNSEFQKVNNMLTELTAMKATNVKIVSQPAENGGRSNDIELHLSNTTVDSQNFRNLWSGAMKIIEKQDNISLGNTYKLTLVSDFPNDNANASVKISALMYSMETLAAAKEISPLMWSTLTAYSMPSGGFSLLNAQEVDYVISPKATTSKVTIQLRGAQPDAATVNALVASFRSTALARDDVYFAYSYITSLKYVDTLDDAYTEYSTNIVY